MKCADCGEEHDWVYLHSCCHTDMPTWVRMKGEQLVVECAFCKKVITTLKLAPVEEK